jgi:hypothetical protein
MASPYIVLTTSATAAAVVYAFWCSIRIAKQSGWIREHVRKEAPEAWEKLNAVERNWNNGQPGIMFLYRKKLVDYPGFEQEVRQLRDLERKMLWGIGVGIACIGLAVAGTELLGWQW